MRIVYLHQYFVGREEAGGTRSYEFGRRLADRGHDVHIVTSDRSARPAGTAGWTTEAVAGMTVHRYPVAYSNAMADAQRIKAFLAFAFASARRARSLSGDLVFATSTPLTIVLPALWAVLGRRVPLVLEIRDLWPTLPIAMGSLRSPVTRTAAELLETVAYRSSERIVALSPGMAEHIVASGVPSGAVTVIPNAADLDLFGPTADATAFGARHDWLGDRVMAVYAGTLGRINGVEYLVDLAREVRELDDSIVFAVVGEGGQVDTVRERAAAAGVLGENLVMLSSVPKREVAQTLAAATVCFSLFRDIPEMRTNSANKFYDALAAGRPVAVNYGGWHRELVEEHGVGLAMPPEVTPGSAREFVEFVRDADRVARAGARARELAEREFSRDQLAAHLEGVLVDAAEYARFHRFHILRRILRRSNKAS